MESNNLYKQHQYKEYIRTGIKCFKFQLLHKVNILKKNIFKIELMFYILAFLIK